MKSFTASLIALTLAVPLMAAESAIGPTAVEAGNYTVDSSKVLVEFEVKHSGSSQYFGVFPAANGTLVLDPRDLATARLDVSVPVERASTINAAFDPNLRGADQFDATRNSTIRFVSTSVTRTGKGTARIAGTLTLHGVSKPFVLDASIVGVGNNPLSKAYTVGFKATGRLMRADFGIGTYAPLVSDEVTLIIAAPFETTN